MNPSLDNAFAAKRSGPSFLQGIVDHANKRLMPVIFREGFTFRGSLGPTLVGHDQFAGYVDFVTETFGQYTTDILAMIEEGNRVGGKMRFYGFHRRELFECHRAAAMCGGQACQSSRFEGTKVRDFLCSATSTA